MDSLIAQPTIQRGPTFTRLWTALAGAGILAVALFACSSGDDGAGSTTGQTGATQFAYVGNFGSDTLQAYTVDPGGNLSPVGQPVQLAPNSDPHDVDVDRAGRFVYVGNHGAPFLSGYRITSDGTLADIDPAPGSPVTDPTDPTNNQPHSSAFDQTGRFLYVITGHAGPSTLKGYTVNADGTLTPIPAQSFSVGQHAHRLTVTPNNLYLYVASEDSGDVFAFSRDVNTGVLTPIGAPVAVGVGAAAVLVDSGTRFAYVPVSAANQIAAFTINADGSITPLAPQATFATGNGPHSGTINGNALYVANLFSNNVNGYRIENDGTLTALPGSPYGPTGGEPNYISVHPNGGFVYTADCLSNTISRFSVNPDGSLAVPPTIAASFPAQTCTTGINFTRF